MLYTPWRNEQKDLIKDCQTYQERYQQVELIVNSNKEQYDCHSDILEKARYQQTTLSVTYWFIHKYLQMFKVRTATDHKNITQLHNPRHTVKTHNRHVPCLHKGDASGFLQKL